MRLFVLCMLSVLGGSTVAMDESATASSASASSLRGSHFVQLLDPRDQVVGGKRAYTYRSEYKRLPLYQFGLGKRWAQRGDDKVRATKLC